MEQLYIQTKFVSYVAPFLERFTKKDNFLWNFRCPFCGDSQKNKYKARGYIYKAADGLLSYQCHNCGEAKRFKGFLKAIAPNLMKDYYLESFKGTSNAVEVSTSTPSSIPQKFWESRLTKVSDLSKIHKANQYLKERAIPEDKRRLFYYTHNFKDFVDSMAWEYHVPDDPRLLLVETDSFGDLKIVIARALSSKNQRYYTLKVDEAYPKLFGLSRLNRTKPVRVVEGAIDSLFVDNAVATLDANLQSYKATDISSPVLIWDNEPRNPDVVRRMAKAIDSGERVVIFPETIECKDINQMWLKGIDVEHLINTNTFAGLQAKIRFSKWKRI
jgi:hypothetical protein